MSGHVQAALDASVAAKQNWYLTPLASQTHGCHFFMETPERCEYYADQPRGVYRQAEILLRIQERQCRLLTPS